MKTRLPCTLLAVSLFAATLRPAESPTPAAHDQGWQLAALWQLAAAQSPDLARARAQIRAARVGVPRARLAYLPQVSAQIGYNNYLKIASVLTFSEPEPYSLYSVGIDLSQTIYDGFRTRHDVALAHGNVQTAELELQEAAEDLSWALTDAFFDAAVAQAEVEGLAPVEALARERLAAIEAQLAVGIIDQLALYRTEGELEDIRRERLDQQLNRQLAEATLARLLNVEASLWEAHDHYALPPALPVDPKAPILGQSAAVELAETELALAERRLKRAAAGYGPTVKLSASASQSSQGNPNFEQRGLEKAVGLTISWGLSDTITTIYDRREARAEIEVAEAEFTGAQREHGERVRSTKLRWQQARDSLALLEEALTRQHRRYESVRTAVAGGLYDRSVLLTEEQTMRSTELDISTAQIELRRQQYLMALLARRLTPAGHPDTQP